jgi:hypothetical protein
MPATLQRRQRGACFIAEPSEAAPTNLKTAKALILTAPPMPLALADDVIE